MSRPSRVVSAGSFARALAEVAMIVVGVLIALAADAWRDRSHERELAASYRAALLDDLVRDSTLYAGLVDSGWFQVQADAVDSLRTLIASDRETADPLTIAQWLQNTLRVAAGSKSSATFEDMRSSGRLSLLEDPNLRRGLIDYYGMPIVIDDRAYESMLPAILSMQRSVVRVMGLEAVLILDACTERAQAAEGRPGLESAAMRSCLEAEGLDSGTDLARRVRSDPGLPGDLQNLSMMRFVGRDGSEIAQGQAAALRASLRGEPPEEGSG